MEYRGGKKSRLPTEEEHGREDEITILFELSIMLIDYAIN